MTVYNKGEDLPTPSSSRFSVIPLPNVGREGHTYYHHIVSNYDCCLATHTAFLQGNPLDPSPDVSKLLVNLQRRTSFHFLSEGILRGTISMDGLLVGCDQNFELWGGVLNDCVLTPMLPLSSVWEKIFGETPEPDREFRYGVGAQFVVSKDMIRERPKAFYQAIVDLLAYDSHPYEGYVIERFHAEVFFGVSGPFSCLSPQEFGKPTCSPFAGK